MCAIACSAPVNCWLVARWRSARAALARPAPVRDYAYGYARRRSACAGAAYSSVEQQQQRRGARLQTEKQNGGR